MLSHKMEIFPMKTMLGLFLITMLLTSCGESSRPVPQQEKDRLAQLGWLLGHWEMVEEGRILAEHWTPAGELSFTGRGLSIRDGDTTVTEQLEIRATDSGLFYIADVPQNAAPVWFGLTTETDSLVVFENPEYQLPNKISYARESEDMIRVRVDGFRGDEPTGFEWLLARAGLLPEPERDSITSE